MYCTCRSTAYTVYLLVGGSYVVPFSQYHQHSMPPLGVFSSVAFRSSDNGILSRNMLHECGTYSSTVHVLLHLDALML